MSSSIKYDESKFLDCIQQGGFRIELSAKSNDGRFLLIAAAPGTFAAQ
jgi:hypothetical protein